MTENQLEQTFLAKVTIGDVQVPDQDTVAFALITVPGNSSIQGLVVVTDATNGTIYNGNVYGNIYENGSDNMANIVILRGTISSSEAESHSTSFEAFLMVDGNLIGVGGFRYNNKQVVNQPVTGSMK